MAGSGYAARSSLAVLSVEGDINALPTTPAQAALVPPGDVCGAPITGVVFRLCPVMLVTERCCAAHRGTLLVCRGVCML